MLNGLVHPEHCLSLQLAEILFPADLHSIICLLSFFQEMSKGRLQQNTYIKERVCLGQDQILNILAMCSRSTFNDWANCFQDHELSLRLARAGAYQHIQSGRTSVMDAAALDKANITAEQSELAVKINSI